MSNLLGVTRVIKNTQELRNYWAELLPLLPPKTILLLNGEVGAGKTTSVQAIADILGMKDVQSPSFAIHLRYENSKGKSLDHIDLYRLKDDDDLESSGFWDLFSQQESLIIIEWASRLNTEYLPLNWEKFEVNILKNPTGDLRQVTARKLDF